MCCKRSSLKPKNPLCSKEPITWQREERQPNSLCSYPKCEIQFLTCFPLIKVLIPYRDIQCLLHESTNKTFSTSAFLSNKWSRRHFISRTVICEKLLSCISLICEEKQQSLSTTAVTTGTFIHLKNQQFLLLFFFSNKTAWDISQGTLNLNPKRSEYTAP